ncbi:MAG: C69 family dipeptidase [Chitinophagaceae bacterium]|nr:C69 family dipeptidase [Chitinophagaceae bacterium]
MKKIVALFLTTAFLLASQLTDACTNFLITKGASKDGSCFISYSADSHILFGELYHWKAARYPKGTMLKVFEWDSGLYLGEMEQAAQTYNVVGNMNEYQVAIGETTFGGREELTDTTGIVDYGSLIYIALQRSKTAREAIKIMTDLVAKYGYYSSGESFSIADPNEVWIMEMIGKGVGNKGAVWVAIRIPDGYISGHANQARIQTFPLNDPENCMYSPDVISFAKSKGYYSGEDKDFSFSDIYAPIDFGAARFCEARVWSGFNKVCSGMDMYLDYAMGKNLHNRMPLYVKPNQKIGLQDVYAMMRDYYQGTPMDMTKDPGAGAYENIVRWRPMTYKVDGASYFNERAISTQQTGFSFVAQCRSSVPAPLGGIIWFGMDDTYSTVYTPMFSCITTIPNSIKVGNGDIMTFSETSAFWLFNQVSNFAYTRYKDMIPDIQARQQELENGFIAAIPEADKKAAALYKKSPAQAIKFLTDFSNIQQAKTFAEWKKLYAHLFTKFLDGNVKTKTDKPMPAVKQPGYSDQFYRNIIEKTGDKFKTPAGGGH